MRTKLATLLCVVGFTCQIFASLFQGGDGSISNPYQIATAEQFLSITNYTPEDYFELVNDIDLSGNTFQGGIIGLFTGELDGNGFAITGMNIVTDDETSDIALFGNIAYDGVVRNLGIKDFVISVPNAIQVASLCYHNAGSIINCFAEGTINAKTGVSGLCVKNSDRGRILNCYFKGNITAEAGASGLCLNNMQGAVIMNSYCDADMQLIGLGSGFCLYNNGYIVNSYSASTVISEAQVFGFSALGQWDGTFLDCFWDREKCPDAEHVISDEYYNGTLSGITTAEMVYRKTYTDAGWSFVDIAKYNGTEDWYMVDGEYPLLSFQEEVPHYRVTFVTGEDGQLISGKAVQSVAEGKSACSPIIIPEPGQWWTGWDVDFGNVTSDLTITATYEDEYSRGDGSPENPFKVATVLDFEQMTYNPDHFILIKDINLSSLYYRNNVIEGFNGVFDGNGFSLIGLAIIEAEEDECGLFGRLNFSATVKNLGLENFTISVGDQWSNVGSLVGINNGRIENCYSVNTLVKGYRVVGGLCGMNNGQIMESYSTGQVTGHGKIGGLCGENFSTIKNCYSTCDVKSNLMGAGGLCGWVDNGYIENCYSTGKVRVSDGNIGYAFCGIAEPEDISNCFWNTDSNPDLLWGIPDYDVLQYPSSVYGISMSLFKCEGTFTDVGWDFIGESDNGGLDIWYMPEDGSPLLSFQEEVPHYTVTFIAGVNGYIIDGKAVQSVAAGTSATSPIIMPEHGLWWTGWDVDFSYVTDNILVNATYSDINDLGGLGHGSPHNPYKVFTVADIQAINEDMAACYILMNDINMGGTVHVNHVIEQFAGSLDGNGFDIIGLSISDSYQNGCGLFGRILTGAIVKNLGLIDTTVSADINRLSVGSLVGVNIGLIENCYSVNAFVKGGTYVGGLCGLNSGYNGIRGRIETSYSSGRVVGFDFVGGLSGGNATSITNCYSNCDIESTRIAGGFCGNSGSVSNITNCYSTGVVNGGLLTFAFCNAFPENLHNCFWNTDANPDLILGIPEYDMIEYPKSITGISSALMRSEPIFTDAGWDFVGDVDGRYFDVWYMPEDGYPLLAWQDEVPHYTVTFVAGENGQIIDGRDVQVVAEGASAISPVVEAYYGNWIGWDVSFSRIVDNIVVNAVYGDSEGDGSAANPYQIFTATDLEAINEQPNAHYILMNDIDLRGLVYLDFIVEYFDGVLNGNGFAINNMTISNIDYAERLGLFGFISQDAVVEKLIIVDSFISVNEGGNFVGALVGENNGRISNCYSGGVIESFDYFGITAGGLCGLNLGTIEKSHNAGAIFDVSNAGGFCGKNDGEIRNCYSMSYVSGGQAIGGFCYYNMETIENSYSAGYCDSDGMSGGFCHKDIGILSGCFWNTQSYGDIIGIYNGNEFSVTGIINAQMAYPNTFIQAGWDLAGSLGDGFDEIWVISGGNFPQFSGAEPVTFDDADLFGMIDQWLGEGSYDIYPDGGDGVVDMKDFIWLAYGWQNDEN